MENLIAPRSVIGDVRCIYMTSCFEDRVTLGLAQWIKVIELKEIRERSVSA